MRVTLSILGCALAVFVSVTLLVHEQLTSPVDRWGTLLVAATRRFWAAHAASAVSRLVDAVPVLTILVVAGDLAPVRWGSGWRLLVLPWASAGLAYLIGFSGIAVSGRAVLIRAPRAALVVPESPR